MARKEGHRILTVQEIADYLRVHPSTIYRLLKKGEIPAFKVGSDWRFVLSEAVKWSKGNTKALSGRGRKRQSEDD